MQHRPISYYARILRPDLPRDVFAPARSRLLWLPLHLAVIVLAATAIASAWVPSWVAPLLSIVIGCSFAGLTFLAHETMHGAVVRRPRARYLVGAIGFLPFLLSPRLWVAWHNRVHHGHSNQPGSDPDANPTLEEYRASPKVRAITDHFALGRRSATGFVGLLVGFSIQSLGVLGIAGRRAMLTRRQHRIAIAETAAAVAFWAGIMWLIGPFAFVFVYLAPILVANAIVMAFIVTNHGLSPVMHTNDPLAGALSVTTPRWVEWVTLGFGYHVEHHLFPGMSARQGPALRDLLRKQWPERYQSMPLGAALMAMHRTGRVYSDEITLADPRTGREWATLQPGLAAVQLKQLERRELQPPVRSHGSAAGETTILEQQRSPCEPSSFTIPGGSPSTTSTIRGTRHQPTSY